ncbi:hypothetical protein VTJ83DRAFT_5516 [Remersonia thermophila]|uniref:Uncharacterized protein n=1 Tax=Remersonia thermophila TaxID=72144 RepID=A0ABR4D7Z3_9PEZI
MQAVPTLVGTGTAAAAAAVGLAFGQPPEPETPWSPPPIHNPFPADYDPFRVQALPPRPSTSAALSRHPYPSPADDLPYSPFRPLADAGPGPLASPPMSPTSPTSPTDIPRPLTGVPSSSSPWPNSRGHSHARHGDLACQPIAENARDSVSSRDSWVRRFSRPLSRHGSRRSSLGPDSSSMAFSNGSGVPMLGQPPTTHPSPNKLVKRATSGPQGPAGGLQRRGSLGLTLRRPATSHQRSATLQQLQQNQGAFAERPLSPDVMVPPEAYVPTPTSTSFPAADRTQESRPSKWSSFFHARRAAPSGRELPGLPQGFFPRRRMAVSWGRVYKAYLTKPDQIAEEPASWDEGDVGQDLPADDQTNDCGVEPTSDDPGPVGTPEPSADKPPRRPLSTHLSSASQWISRTGSGRLLRRNTVDAKIGGGRFLPESSAVPRDHAYYPPVGPGPEGFPAPPEARDPPPQHSDPALKHQADLSRTRKRNSSSPAPPHRRLSSGFSIDVARASSNGLPRPLYSPPVNYPRPSSATTHSRGPSGERSVTLAGSDASAREPPFGDDEDTDFRSDGIYDSFRTGTSSTRVRSVETPIESMYDDSPPSTASHPKTQRLSVQEMLPPGWDGETTKITEEEELAHTPVKAVDLAEVSDAAPKVHDLGLDGAHALSAVTRDFDRQSFFDEDDDDDDWARDDDNPISNHLSPPGSTNSRHMSPTQLHALRNISGSSTGSSSLLRNSMSDRPRSNIFDWAEPSPHDTSEAGMPRPKTVHGKRELVLRGGRPATRKPIGAAHIRSQSVPVVHDSDGSKPPPKFGTWALGHKKSERWDEDFEFEGDDAAAGAPGGKDSATSFTVVVPASIQATQPSVRAHSGQIRELSLLVNDLKRLCRHGKELDLLQGPLAAKWTEAESIIALASPDEEEDEAISTRPSFDCDRPQTDDLFLDEGFDGSALDFDETFGFSEPEMSKTAVVRERQSPKRRSVFSPDDDIFGGSWPLNDGSGSGTETGTSPRPHTPSRTSSPNRHSAVINTVIDVLKQQQQKSARAKNPPVATATARPAAPDTKLYFDTNSLQVLVKQAGQLRDVLSDAVRRSELLTQSPAGTPRRERHNGRPHPCQHQPGDGSPAFTRVFVDPGSTASTPPGQRSLATSHSTPSILSKASVDSPRMQMMTAVN